MRVIWDLQETGDTLSKLMHFLPHTAVRFCPPQKRFFFSFGAQAN